MLAALTLAFALSAEPSGVHLDASAHRARIVFASAAMTPEQIAESPVERLTLSQLQLEQRRLVDPPTIVTPVVLMSVGGAGLVGCGALAYWLFAQVPGSGLGGIILVFLGLVAAAVAVVGAAALITGIVLLPSRTDARQAYLDRQVAVRARLAAIQAGTVVAPPEPDAVQAQTLYDIDRLEQLRPSVGLPIGLMAGGFAVSAYSAFYWVSAASGSSGSSGSVIALGVGGIVAGLIAAGIGTYLLIDRLGTRGEIDSKIQQLRDGASPGTLPEQAPPGGDVVPPPPPPPPPQAWMPPPPPLFAQVTFQF